MHCLLLLALARDAPSSGQRATLERGKQTEPAIISLDMREQLLRAFYAKRAHDSPHAEWHSPVGERLLSQLLDHLPEEDPSEQTARRVKRGNEDIDLEGLWLLCRAQIGAIEAAQVELGEAAERACQLRLRWQRISARSSSLALSNGIRNGLYRLKRALLPDMSAASAARRVRSRRVGGGVLRRRIANPASAAAVSSMPARPSLSTFSEATFASPFNAIAPLGSGRTRLGLGIRRRALLRSEQALACHAGALHDLRVLLRDVGGEWLELGRWVGGPPLPTMPWDVQVSEAAALPAPLS